MVHTVDLTQNLNSPTGKMYLIGTFSDDKSEGRNNTDQYNLGYVCGEVTLGVFSNGVNDISGMITSPYAKPVVFFDKKTIPINESPIEFIMKASIEGIDVFGFWGNLETQLEDVKEFYGAYLKNYLDSIERIQSTKMKNERDKLKDKVTLIHKYLTEYIDGFFNGKTASERRILENVLHKVADKKPVYDINLPFYIYLIHGIGKAIIENNPKVEAKLSKKINKLKKPVPFHPYNN